MRPWRRSRRAGGGSNKHAASNVTLALILVRPIGFGDEALTGVPADQEPNINRSVSESGIAKKAKDPQERVLVYNFRMLKWGKPDIPYLGRPRPTTLIAWYERIPTFKMDVMRLGRKSWCNSPFYTKPGNGHWAATSVVNADQEFTKIRYPARRDWIRRNERTVCMSIGNELPAGDDRDR